jgi:hypothetical protein
MTDTNVMLSRIALKYGITGAIAAFLVYHMVAHQDLIGEETLSLLKAHQEDTSHFLYQNCVNTAMLAGTPKELCLPPSAGQLPH